MAALKRIVASNTQTDQNMGSTQLSAGGFRRKVTTIYTNFLAFGPRRSVTWPEGLVELAVYWNNGLLRKIRQPRTDLISESALAPSIVEANASYRVKWHY